MSGSSHTVCSICIRPSREDWLQNTRDKRRPKHAPHSPVLIISISYLNTVLLGGSLPSAIKTIKVPICLRPHLFTSTSARPQGDYWTVHKAFLKWHRHYRKHNLTLHVWRCLYLLYFVLWICNHSKHMTTYSEIITVDEGFQLLCAFKICVM